MISMKEGTITMEVGDNKVSFNMYEAMKHPYEDYSLLGVNMIDIVVEDACSKVELQNDSFYSDIYTDESIDENESISSFSSLYSTPLLAHVVVMLHALIVLWLIACFLSHTHFLFPPLTPK